MKDPQDSKSQRDATRAITRGRTSFDHHGVVNTPVYHASTILHPDVDAFEERHDPSADRRKVIYGLLGTPTTFDLEEVIADLEGGHDAVLVPSGLAAISVALLSFLRPGDHLLVADTVYPPTRSFCDQHLARLDITVDYYDPLVGGEIVSLITARTRVIFLESPGSFTFEVQDIPAITEVAREHGVTTVLDNTWATPLFFKSFSHGVDVSVHAATKYLSGHSDVVMGAIICAEHAWDNVRRTHRHLGQCVGPDDAYVTLRSIRNLSTRLNAHHKQGLALAQWLAQREEVAQVLHPGLPGHPGHALWQRDFLGASGLFSIVLQRKSREAVLAMVNGMELFRIGASWGGFESLMIPVHPEQYRSATTWDTSRPTLRIHAGLEDLDDLIADLEAGFARLNGKS
ncbi:MAG TPA: cystathionine beta-lyase [Gammaproteobacteria bacterium]|jgi:cystathionine beta-lyase|nr:cystathionine beta-lyase [Acidiferrobacteraceae bacterium]MDP6551039.1 cystathionine beta-lyase [Arenicellales bacterium]MDP6791850.1 cystathionine beta-lyase [Arenicellales bacterium]MDP6918302.1 cystathionine beta-lyase [Arenicellales bacterium]HCX87893.1 cystathionine beta-lyase [Gammaproteobacteria bacterium]|tara:strand:+ start:24567 stop:25766 length:1200 start_codon:yes stop_codon:yes gene_type:complete